MEKWFKFYSADYLLDGKIRNLTAEERSCWISLLCLADTSDIPGEIKHLNEYDLLIMSGLSPNEDNWQRTEKVLKKFEDLEMIRNDNGMITVLNFRKRQGKALSEYERVKKYREKKRNDNDVITPVTNDNVDDNARIEENRIEENRIEENKKRIKEIKNLKPLKTF